MRRGELERRGNWKGGCLGRALGRCGKGVEERGCMKNCCECARRRFSRWMFCSEVGRSLVMQTSGFQAFGIADIFSGRGVQRLVEIFELDMVEVSGHMNVGV